MAVSFARSGVPVIGFDIDAARVAELRHGNDRTREVEADDLRHATLVLTADSAALKQSDFYIVSVPTPIYDARRPDVRAMIAASRSVGSASACRFLPKRQV